MCHFLHPQYASQRFTVDSLKSPTKESKGKSSDGKKTQPAQEVVAASDFQHQSEVGKRGGDALDARYACLLERIAECSSNYYMLTLSTERVDCQRTEVRQAYYPLFIFI